MTSSAPAGFWRRYAAYSLDFTALGSVATLLAWTRLVAGWRATVAAVAALSASLQAPLLDALASGSPPGALYARLLDAPAVQAGAEAVQSALLSMATVWLLAYAVLAALYHVGFERSRWHGSPGKHALGLRVVAMDGDRPPTLAQTLVRHLAGALSWLSLNLGHALAAVAPQKRALHDYIAGTRVLQDDAAQPLPGWARAWLWLQVIAVLLALAWLLQRDLAALQASLD